MKLKQLIKTTAVAACAFAVSSAFAAGDEIVIANVFSKSGPLEAYGKQQNQGLKLGLEYATKGTMTVTIAGKPMKLKVIEKDDQGKPDRARALTDEAMTDEDALIVVGPTSSAATLAALPMAAKNKRIIMPTGVADSVTGKDWNKYVVRVARNSSQDAAANAIAHGGPGSCVGAVAQDYAFGRDGIRAYKAAVEKTGAKWIYEEYLPQNATDFTATIQKVFDAYDKAQGCQRKMFFQVWAGGTGPMPALGDAGADKKGIKMAVAGNILPALTAYKQFPGAEGAAYYYFEHMKGHPANEWLIREYQKKYKAPPDFFVAQGMSEGIAIVEALKKANAVDADKLVTAFEGLTFDSPRGKQTIRAEDHQSMQDMFHFRVKVDPNVTWAIPELVRVIKASEMNIPILNKR